MRPDPGARTAWRWMIRRSKIGLASIPLRVQCARCATPGRIECPARDRGITTLLRNNMADCDGHPQKNPDRWLRRSQPRGVISRLVVGTDGEQPEPDSSGPVSRVSRSSSAGPGSFGSVAGTLLRIQEESGALTFRQRAPGCRTRLEKTGSGLGTFRNARKRPHGTGLADEKGLSCRRTGRHPAPLRLQQPAAWHKRCLHNDGGSAAGRPRCPVCRPGGDSTIQLHQQFARSGCVGRIQARTSH